MKKLIFTISCLCLLHMTSCDTIVASTDDQINASAPGLDSLSSMDGEDYLTKVRVVEVGYSSLMASTFFNCEVMGSKPAKTIRVNTTPCYKPTIPINPNDTITILVNMCGVCTDGANYWFPFCEK